MDPNLEKIAEYHLEEINRGYIIGAIKEASSYLHMMLGVNNMNDIKKELELFKQHVSELQNGDK